MKLFLLAGEASGDRLGADLMRGLRHLTPDVTFRGIAGPEMQSEGLDSLFDMSELSVMGLAEVLPKYFALKRRLDQTVAEVLAWKPDILITIDSPDFSLRVARAVRAADPKIRTCHYVAPSVWAWRAGRAKKMAGFIDHVLALLPFEPPYMEAEGMACDFVGHPVAAQAPITSKQIAKFQADYALDPARESLVILPGSRPSEIKRLLPVFCQVLSEPCFADFQLIFPTLPHLEPLLCEALEGLPQETVLVTGSGLSAAAAAEERLVAYGAAKAALAASGTVSLELAAAGTPMVIAYDMGLISRLIIGAMLQIDTVTLVNLVSETRAVPEFIGRDCKAAQIAPALRQILSAPAAQAQAIEETMIAPWPWRSRVALSRCARGPQRAPIGSIPGDPTTAQNPAAIGIIENASLARRHTLFGHHQLYHRFGFRQWAQDCVAGRAGGADFCGYAPLGLVSQRLVAKPIDFLKAHLPCRQHLFRSNHHMPVFDIQTDHIDGIRQSTDAKTASLANGIMDNALMGPQNFAALIDNVTRLCRAWMQLFNDRRVVTIWYKANILAVRFIGHTKAVFARQSARFSLGGQMPQRESQIFELLGRG